MGMDESPFFNERYRNEFEAWRDAVSLTQGALRSDFETKPAFIPGVGYMRPFIRYAAFIPPADPTAKPVFTGETEANLKTMHDKFKQIAQTSAALQAMSESAMGNSIENKPTNVYPAKPIDQNSLAAWDAWANQNKKLRG
eukprot:c8810_g1_i2.p1 GENE.c8810_g1_i2~~c8810_g1_i2.p1  ORF type:complete len:140 (+),score=37.39 c8810_g1_i2:92-511(+)